MSVKKHQHTTSKKNYIAPTAISMKDVQSGIGDCNAGSGDLTCYAYGNNAIFTCFNTGSSAVGRCFGNGSSAFSDCSYSGNSPGDYPHLF